MNVPSGRRRSSKPAHRTTTKAFYETFEARRPVVVLDPGHGGSATVGGSSPNNAKGPGGLLEKEVTLDLARRAKPLLEGAGVEVLLTRDRDRNLGLEQRAAIAKARSADAFVSIHLNGFNGAAQGTETFHHTNGSSDCRSLATLVQRGVQKTTGLKDRGVKEAKYGVLRPDYHAPTTAACLVEASFMDVPAEEDRLRTDAYKDRIAQALANAVEGWLIADQRMPPRFERDVLDQRMLEDAPQDGFEMIRMTEGAGGPPDEQARSDAGSAFDFAVQTSDEAVPFLAEPAANVIGKGAGGIADLKGMLSGWRQERLTLEGAGAMIPEIIIGTDESLDAAFLELLAKKRLAVGVVRTSGRAYDGQTGRWSGTGFLVAPNILLTNHHVLNSAEVAAAATVAFDYEVSAAAIASGKTEQEPTAGKSYRLDPDKLFVTSGIDDGLDYSFVWIDGVDVESSALIRMERAAFAIQPEERAFLIHHPGGRPKRVSLDDTEILAARPDGAVIHYTTDSEPGSSGCPAFDRTGRLIALHHAARDNVEAVARSDGTAPRYVNEGIKISAIALDLEMRRQSDTDGMIAVVLGEIYGSDTLTGYFGAAGRTVGQLGAERVVDVYNATDQDVDVGFWNVEWFANRFEDKCEDVANIIVDLGLDIWALVESSPAATEALVERIRSKFGLELRAEHSQPTASTAKQTTSVIWNPATVDGERLEWPAEIDRLFQLSSEEFAGLESRRPPKPGKIFDRYPGLFRFAARNGRARGIDFNLVPLHLKAMDDGWERRRMASQILARAVERMIREHGADKDWVLGGDFNAELASRDFEALSNGDFRPVSAADEAAGAMTYLKSPHSLIDHIFLSPNLSRLYGEQDYFILAKEKSQVDYLKRFSDHRPVMLRFSAGGGQVESVQEGGGKAADELNRRIDAILGGDPRGRRAARDRDLTEA